jgi:hypothetical protein
MIPGDVGRSPHMDTERIAARKMARQLARVLILDSVTERCAVAPSYPMVRRIGEWEIRNLLAGALLVHATDCKTLDARIPLLIVVPACYAEEAEECLVMLGYGGLGISQVHLLAEPDSPAIDDRGTVMTETRFLAGGGVTLAHAVEDGTLSKLWKSGVRWLLCTPLATPREIASSPILPHLEDITKDGMAELVDRKELPDSILLPLVIDGRNICTDKRQLAEEDLAKVRDAQVVCSGTFWLRCDKFALLFGVTVQQLEGPWDPAAWKGTIGADLNSESGIYFESDGLAANIVPLWEVIRPLNMAYGKLT